MFGASPLLHHQYTLPATDTNPSNIVVIPSAKPAGPVRSASTLSPAGPASPASPASPANPSDVKVIGQKYTEIHDEKTNDVLNPNHTVSYSHVVKILKESYNFDENITSTSLDILALYLKGQKIIYTESKTYCEKRLNTLMLPAILLAAVCSILNFILKDYANGTIIISSLNAANSFILSIINYLKLAEKSQNHLMAAQRFHNLESRIELKSGRSLFFGNTVDIEKTLEEIEHEIKEIQSSDQFIVPEAIRYRYPKIYSSNIFALVKEIKNSEMLIINDLKTAVQAIYTYTEERNELKKKEKDYLERYRKFNNEKYELELQVNLIDQQLTTSKNTPLEYIVESEDELEDEVLVVDHMEDPKEQERSEMNLEAINQKIRERNKERMERREEKKKLWTRREKEGRRVAMNAIQNELSRCELSLKQTTSRATHMKGLLAEVREDIQKKTDLIDRCDQAKNEAFAKTVIHRQRYIDLSDTLNREIDQHIKNTKRWHGCSPCDFFNT
jgi:pSer/pThr/pTyr-binding forkhead associated (FHA) protein